MTVEGTDIGYAVELLEWFLPSARGGPFGWWSGAVRRASAEPRSGTTRRVAARFPPLLECFLSRRSTCFSSTGPTSRTQAPWIGVHQKADKMTLEIDFMNALAHWLEAHALAAEGSANDSHSSVPANVAALRNTARRPSPTVSQFGQPTSIRAPALAIEVCGHLLLQCLVRTIVVVVANETCGALLLAPWRGCRRRSRFGPVNSMHLFMSRIVLGSSPTGKLHLDSQPQPPGRESRQIQRAVASKGRTVVDADDFGLSTLDEQALEILAHRFVTLLQQSDAQQVAAEEIAHGQRVHAPPVSSAKPAFEIHSPHLVGLSRDGQRPSGQLRPPMSDRPTRTHPSLTPQPLGDGSHLGQSGARMLSAQVRINLLCPPNADGALAPGRSP